MGESALTPEPIRWQKLLPFVLALIIANVFANSLTGPFIANDIPGVLEDPSIWRLTPVSKLLEGSSRPLVKLSLAINYALDQDNVAGYHLWNLAVHMLAAVVLYGLVARTLTLPALGSRFEASAPWLAFLTAVLWAIHPLTTQSVDYISQRAESMMGLFYLLTLFFAVGSFESSRAWLWHVAAVACCWAGMMCKQPMATAPLVVLLVDRSFGARMFVKALRRRMVLYIGLGLSWVLLAWLITQGRNAASDAAAANAITPWEYLISQPQVILHYVRLAVWPDALVFDYMWPAPASLLAVLPAVGLVMAFVAAVVYMLIRRWPAGVFGAVFLTTLAPTSSVVPMAAMAAEHRMYLPLVAVVAAVVIGGYVLLSMVAPAPQRVVFGVIVLFAAAVALASLTMQRNKEYQSARTLWETVVERQPYNWRAMTSLARMLTDESEDANFERSLALYAKVLELKPDHFDALLQRGTVLLAINRPKPALEDLTKAVSVVPDEPRAHFMLGMTMMRLGRFQDAESKFRKTIKLSPAMFGAYNNLGIALARQQKADEAEKVWRKLLSLNDDVLDPHLNLGRLLLDQGRLDESISQYQRAVEVAPGNERCHMSLANVLERAGYIEQAIEAYRNAIQVAPTNAQVRLHLALVLSSHPKSAVRDATEAVALIEDARKILGSDTHNVLNALAAAQAEMGDFGQAIETIKLAIRHAQLSGQDVEVLALLSRRLALYEHHMPLRNDPALEPTQQAKQPDRPAPAPGGS